MSPSTFPTPGNEVVNWQIDENLTVKVPHKLDKRVHKDIDPRDHDLGR